MQVVCSVYDSKAECFLMPWVVRTKNEAARQFLDSVNNPQNATLHQHPEDYTLFCVGHWDEFTGQIRPLEAHEAITNGLVARPDGPSAGDALQNVKDVLGAEVKR